VKQDALGVDRRAATREVAGNGGAGGLEAEGRGVVASSLVPGERREERGRVGQ
jgi:hypothetical protein